MIPYHFCCVLCGAPILEELDDAQIPQWGWMREFRAVYADVTHKNPQALLSGHGLCQLEADQDGILVDPHPPAEGETKRAEKVRIHLLLGSPRYRSDDGAKRETPLLPCGFPFHAACWTILSDCSPTKDVDIQALLACCLSAHTQREPQLGWGVLNWGHNYGGLHVYWRRPEEAGPAEEPIFSSRTAPGAFAGTNPADCVELRSLFEQAASKSDSITTSASIPCEFRPVYRRGKYSDTSGNPTNVFSVLPVELLRGILEWLPLDDVFSLRLACRDFASLGLQNDSFWRSRFLPGRDLDYVLEARPHLRSLKGQWRSLFLCARHPSQLFDAGAFTNRRRVYALASSLCDLVREAKAYEGKCYGKSYNYFCRDAAEKSQLSWVMASRFGQYEPRSLEHLQKRSARIPARTTGIFASTITIHGCRYITGIRIRMRTERSEHSLRLGYQHPLNETLLAEPEEGGLCIRGFMLALDFQGIRGISVVTDYCPMSRWAGDYKGLPKRRLVPSSSNQDPARFVRGGFDALKLRFLSVSNGAPKPEPGEETSALTARDLSAWYPDIPSPHVKFPDEESLIRPPHPEDAPPSFAIFGSQGQDLRRVTGIAFFQDTRAHGNRAYKCVLALQVCFNDTRAPVWLGPEGPRWREVAFFPVDGEGGEYVTDVGKVAQDGGGDSDARSVRLKITTNRGRMGLFPGGECETPEDEPREASGKVVGFWARTSGDWGFVDFGAVCI